MDDKTLLEWYKNNLHAYYCCDCEERFHLESIVNPNIVHCPHCGDRTVSINSESYKKLNM